MYHVTLLGDPARRALGVGTHWSVLAVFRRSFYCRSGAGRLICLGPTALGGGPLNVLCAIPPAADWPAAGLHPGMAAGCDGAALTFPEGTRFTFRDAARWRPTPPPPGWQSIYLSRGVDALRSRLAAHPPRNGLWPLLLPLAVPASGPRLGTAACSPLLRAAVPGIHALEVWLGESMAGGGGAPPFLPSAVRALVGLGPGLTPSGDDFLCGAMIALHSLGWGFLARRLAAQVIDWGQHLTHAISLAHLDCAGGGEGSAPLHDVIAALGTPDVPGLAASLTALDTIGHTSGWDALAGLLAVSRVHLAQERHAPPGGRSPGLL